MERVRTQAEIDAMLKKPAGRKEEETRVETRSILPCNFGQSGLLSSHKAASINAMHEAFARSLNQSMGAYLRTGFEVKFVSAEQLSYSEFLTRVPEHTYVMCFEVEKMDGSSTLFQMDYSLVFPLLDILLGGTGHCAAITREISEIEEPIIEDIVKIICRDLEAAWSPIGAKLQIEGRKTPTQMQRFLSPSDKTLCLSFEVRLADVTGMLNFVLPISVANTLLRKLSADTTSKKTPNFGPANEKLEQKLLNCSFPVDLGISDIRLSIETITKLRANDVCSLGIPAKEPAALMIAGRKAFEAYAVRHGNNRAAQVKRRLAITGEERRQYPC
jgi:flagellar motor switch protein FliM